MSQVAKTISMYSKEEIAKMRALPLYKNDTVLPKRYKAFPKAEFACLTQAQIKQRLFDSKVVPEKPMVFYLNYSRARARGL